jgi:type I restriction enzyme R subunit
LISYINFNESDLEKAFIELLMELDYEYKYGPDIAYDGDFPERKDYREVILEQRVRDALFRLNRDLPDEAIEEAYRKIKTFNSPLLEENNRYFHKLLVEGIDVPVREKGLNRTKKDYYKDSCSLSSVFCRKKSY